MPRSNHGAFKEGRPPPLDILPALTLSSKDPAFPPFAPFFAWLSLNLLGVKCLKVQFAIDLAMAFTSDKGKGVMNWPFNASTCAYTALLQFALYS